MTNVLIIGAHAQIARVATRLLLDRTDAQLTLYLRKAQRLSALADEGRVTVVEGDVLDATALNAAMAGQDIGPARWRSRRARSSPPCTRPT